MILELRSRCWQSKHACATRPHAYAPAGTGRACFQGHRNSPLNHISSENLICLVHADSIRLPECRQNMLLSAAMICSATGYMSDSLGLVYRRVMRDSSVWAVMRFVPGFHFMPSTLGYLWYCRNVLLSAVLTSMVCKAPAHLGILEQLKSCTWFL